MVYEFRCRRCGKRFEVFATLAEKEAGLAPQCPGCGSTDASRVWGRVMLLSSGGHDDGDDFGSTGAEAGGPGGEFGGGGLEGDRFGGDGSDSEGFDGETLGDGSGDWDDDT